MHTQHEALQRHRAYALVDTEALIHNYRGLSEGAAVTPHTVSIAVVKADAYGHGVAAAAHALYGAGCRHFAVATLEEALELSHILQDTPPRLILVLGYTAPENAAILAEYRITATILSEHHATSLLDCARKAGVTVLGHIALDTGMNRIGYPAHTESEIIDTVAAIKALYRNAPTTDGGGLIPDGLFTHFARADEDHETEMNTPDSLTMTQYTRFRAVLDGLGQEGIRPRVCHICNSAAAIRFPEALPEGCMDAVRLGIALYGYGVKPPEKAGAASIRPTMRLETAVTHIHTLLPGETAGYGGEFAADTPRTLATLPVGYADGWLRAFSGANVTFHTPEGDRTAPIVGRICMDQCMADVTDLPVTVGTPVTLFGQSSGELEALSDRAGTIPYELLCLITARVPRVY